RFLAQLPLSSKILDAGCGVGRDAHVFENLGHKVTAFDGSFEMVKLANQILKEPAKLMLFQDIDFSEEFDGVWAVASLIHVPKHQ
ncbi:MAG: class I SAM-dependent methyltransferase, partial [Alphaproteobacteria bacterium]|nr:class I SAM-dependent methyltransferase [Alphaproteobacteria bacterium]